MQGISTWYERWHVEREAKLISILNRSWRGWSGTGAGQSNVKLAVPSAAVLLELPVMLDLIARLRTCRD